MVSVVGDLSELLLKLQKLSENENKKLLKALKKIEHEESIIY